jgi:gamma-glutamyltranspeptidase / glutathione hydrolase
VVRVVRPDRFLILFLCLGLLACSGADPDSLKQDRPQPDGLAQQFMVSAANPLAVEAGLSVLRKGGNAVDAAVAVQMVLGFVEPSESGIGGGGFLLFRDGSTGTMSVFDGRETAPSGADSGRFLLPGGFPMPLWAAVVSGRSVGVPGLVAMLHKAHQEHGLLPWNELFEPAIELAEKGIPMPTRLRGLVASDPTLWIFSDLRRCFVLPARDDEPVLSNTALALIYKRIAAEGPDGLYGGETAAALVAAVEKRVLAAGDLTHADLRSYAPIVRDPLCGRYREWTVCGPPPPSAGGIGVLQILGMLEHFALAEMEPGSLEAVHLLAEAGRLAHADRIVVGDPDFVEVPVRRLIDPVSLADRAKLIASQTTNPSEAARIPQKDDASTVVTLFEERTSPGTSHFSIIDSQGNVVAMTSSIEAPFGSRIMVDGFLLNNQLTDFSFRPVREGRPAPNRVEAGKRPRSAMSPTIVLDPDGEIRLVIGSRGGPRIASYVAKTIIGVLDWNLPIQEAIALPNVVGQSDVTEIEERTSLVEVAGELERMRHQVNVRPLTSGLHGIERIFEGWRGGADPRLDGIARGE